MGIRPLTHKSAPSNPRPAINPITNLPYGTVPDPDAEKNAAAFAAGQVALATATTPEQRRAAVDAQRDPATGVHPLFKNWTAR